MDRPQHHTLGRCNRRAVGPAGRAERAKPLHLTIEAPTELNRSGTMTRVSVSAVGCPVTCPAIQCWDTINTLPQSFFMDQYPHHYAVSASARTEGWIDLESDGLPSIESAPPAQFGGPGDRWSPETLLVAAVADCFILTFRAIARASKLEWQSLHCSVDGILDRVDKQSCFTAFALRVELTVPSGTDEQRALHLLEKAEQGCLITNSLKSEISLDASIRQVQDTGAS